MPRSLTKPRHLSLAPVACLGALALACAGSSRPRDVDRLQAHVTGLTGQGLVLLVNEVSEVPVASAGTVDLGAMPAGGIFSVAVKSPPVNPAQRCSVTPQSGTMQSGGATVEVTCADDDHAFSGLVTGLTGSGLVLELAVEGKAAEDVSVPARAQTFAFTTRALAGASYQLDVKTQPAGPAETCTIQNPRGQVADQSVQFQVVCSSSTSVVSGAVAGLRASGLVLLLNDDSDLAVPAGATSFAFPPIANGTPYTVSVGAQPAGQRCAVTNPSGEAGVTTAPVAVTCVDTHAFAGSVTGLAGRGLTLELTAGDAAAESVQVPAGATAVAFATRAAAGDAFAVRVATPPSGPAQDCSVTPERGTVGQGDVQLQLACTTRTFTVGGTVTNLRGTGLVLRLNGSTTLAVPAGATTFAFPALPDGSHYVVDLATATPAGPTQTCRLTAGAEGDLAGADVTGVQVSCTTHQYAVSGSVSAPPAGDGFTLALYQDGPQLTVAQDASSFAFAAVDSGTALDLQVVRQPTTPSQVCTVENGTGTVAANDVANVKITCHAVWRQVAAGYEHTVALAQDGTLWAFGHNAYGAVGDGTAVDRSTPMQIGVGQIWISIAAGGLHSVALARNGTAWRWGVDGQMSVWTGHFSRIPEQVGNDRPWTSVIAGSTHSLGIGGDGTLWAWGYNALGQVGDGTTTNQLAPVQVGRDRTWDSVDGGRNHTLAIARDGTLWAWGQNDSGQVGDGTTTGRPSPVPIASARTWISVSGGEGHSAAIATGDTLWTWGLNTYGQLGDGTTGNRSSPVQVGTSRPWASVAAAYSHTLAIARDGTLWAWGYNAYGQLGDGSTIDRSSPVSIGTGRTWAQASGGANHSAALAPDGTLWTWGRNYNGQLGNGTTTDSPVPVQIW